MIKGLLLTANLLLSVTAMCQYKTLLSEDFKNNKAGWPLQKDSSFLVDIRQGTLHLEKFNKNYDDRGCLWYHKKINGLNTLQDFSITIYARFISGGDLADVFDIQWGQWDKAISNVATRLYQLNFFLKGGVRLDYFQQRWDYSLREKASELLNRNLYQPNVYNKYELIQKDGFIILNVNDQQYFKQFVTPTAGNAIGFQHCLKSAWEIDKIIVKQARHRTILQENGDQPLLIAITDSALKAREVADSILTVYPNPFVDAFTVSLSVAKATNTRLELLDIKGTLLLEYNQKLEAGKHSIRLFADVPSGTYLLRATVDNKTTTVKLLKL